MSEIVSVYHGTRTTAESASGKRFRARNVRAEAKRIAALYEVEEEAILASAQFEEAQRGRDEAQQFLSVSGHYETAVRYATHSSDVVGLLLDAVQELRGETLDTTSQEAFVRKHLSQHEGEPIVLEFRLPLDQLLAAHPFNRKPDRYTTEQVAEPFSEFFLPEKLAVTYFSGTSAM